MHSLSVTNIRIQLAPHKKYIKKLLLHARLAEIRPVRQATFNITKNLFPQGLVGPKSMPIRLIW
jgi:hypothetical protein